MNDYFQSFFITDKHDLKAMQSLNDRSCIAIAQVPKQGIKKYFETLLYHFYFLEMLQNKQSSSFKEMLSQDRVEMALTYMLCKICDSDSY